MKTLAIHGHPTKGEEVIEILKMLGGINKADLSGSSFYLYYIDCNNHIDLSSKLQDTFVTFHLEEFLKKYPYKIGDKVQYKWSTSCDSIYIIEDILWEDNQIKYIICNPWCKMHKSLAIAENLQSYKEDENMNQENETNPQEINYKINLNNPCLEGYNKIELILPDNWKFKQKDGKIFGVRKQYPKTYEECKLLLQTNCTIPSKPGYREYKIALFQELIICRDAYWKIAGEEMGLSGSWVPENPAKHYIFVIDNFGGMIRKNEVVSKTVNRILFFPTKEMRDAFFENFKDLIEKCKEFL